MRPALQAKLFKNLGQERWILLRTFEMLFFFISNFTVSANSNEGKVLSSFSLGKQFEEITSECLVAQLTRKDEKSQPTKV